ncbi:uncharacterized protein LOC142645222 [Dermatophagoides pteronyssinus]|uniref:uncharacterized protein LOC142645222 n=1 Tax=Dermatophagoides pteronyssinus TaxID=6956 RepID=UPI003F66A851
MKNSNQQNYLLDWLIINYGYTGIQMKSIQWSDWKSIINMIINLIINLIIFYTFVIKRYISWDIIINDKLSYNNHKNLNDFIRIFSEYYGQIMWSFMTIYQYVYMPSIARKKYM